MMLTLLFVPSSEMARLFVDQFAVVRFEFCSNTKFAADEGHETEKLPPAGTMMGAVFAEIAFCLGRHSLRLKDHPIVTLLVRDGISGGHSIAYGCNGTAKILPVGR